MRAAGQAAGLAADWCLPSASLYPLALTPSIDVRRKCSTTSAVSELHTMKLTGTPRPLSSCTCKYQDQVRVLQPWCAPVWLHTQPSLAARLLGCRLTTNA